MLARYGEVRRPTLGMGDGRVGDPNPSSAWVIEFECLVGVSQRQQFEQRVERELWQW